MPQYSLFPTVADEIHYALYIHFSKDDLESAADVALYVPQERPLRAVDHEAYVDYRELPLEQALEVYQGFQVWSFAYVEAEDLSGLFVADCCLAVWQQGL